MSSNPPGTGASEAVAAPAPEWQVPEWARPTDRSNLGACLARLEEAIDFAGALKVQVAGATAVRDQVVARMGFPADVYTLALVGGTGVGKSSLLNALAGSTVSVASVRRPTTGRPVAWVPAASRNDLVGLLEHLDVHEIREHADQALGSVAILDLPDMDSVNADHRERVEALLPRVDAVLWVTDLEKYHDAVLHDIFLKEWIGRLDRQLVILNKADRLAIDDAERVRRDLQLDLDRLAAGHAPGPGVILASATAEGRSGPGVASIRGWLAQGVEAKAIVRARLAASIVAATDGLATAAGVDPSGPGVELLLEAPARHRTIEQTTAAVLRVVDLPATQRQAIAATRAQARSRGAGPLGRLTAAVYRWSGRQAQVADPVGFLGRWRERGSLAPAVEAIREAVAEPIRRSPTAVRAALSETVDAARLEPGLAAAIDRSVANHGTVVPGSRVWPLLGLLQTLVTSLIVFAAAWLVLWVIIRFPVDELALPVLGRVPMPLVLLLAALLAGFLIARLLAFHAGWLGRRWARRLAAEIHHEISLEIAESAFAPLDWVETVQQGVWTAARAARTECGGRARR